MDPLKIKFVDFVGPTIVLSRMSGSVAASSLNSSHFTTSKNINSTTKKGLTSALENKLNEMFRKSVQELVTFSSGCEFAIYESSDLLMNPLQKDHSKRIKNKATLRFVVGDPLMRMICKFLNARVR